jgi:hypothetical protein
MRTALLVDPHLECSVHKGHAIFDKNANATLCCHMFQHQKSNLLVVQTIFASLGFRHHYVIFKEINKCHILVFNSSQTVGIYQQGSRLWMWQAVYHAASILAGTAFGKSLFSKTASLL